MKRFLACLVLAMTIPGLLYGENADKEKKLSWGFDERIRMVGADNFIDANRYRDDEWNFFRFRTRFWTEYSFSDRVKVYGRVANEFREWMKPERDFTLNETVFDSLYLETKGVLSSKLTLKVGRQDMMLGEGFLVLDGSPLDGSRTIYFNAARATWQISKGSLDAFVISNPGRERYLPVVTSQNQGMIEQAEHGAGLYLTKEISRNIKGEFYNIFKREQRFGAHPGSDLNTFGTRLSGTVPRWFDYAGECAYQAGTYGPNSRRGFGGYYDVKRKVERLPALTFKFNHTVLSGDDPGTSNHEGWNPIFSRWPKWSELYIYTLIPEHRPAYWTNLNMISPGVNWKISDTCNLDFNYRIMRSLHQRVLAPGVLSGKDRGNMWIALLNMRVNPRISAHLLGEFLEPGGFYPEGRKLAYFLRAEIMYRLQR